MIKTVIAVFGVSGVGKSTLLGKIAAECPSKILHLQAGQLIKDRQRITDSEKIRTVKAEKIIDNQNDLIEEFYQKCNISSASLVLFDGHCIVDNNIDLVPIPVSVIKALTPKHLVFVHDNPEKITARCLGDSSRQRPVRTAAYVDNAQKRAIDTCREYEKILGIPLDLILPDDSEGLRTLVASYLQ